ncbi:acetolactate synthase-1/2/3 large subunit [Amycolatopsis bartoniae]|uniref:Acetolactate synthase I/II/III large subunit n=1 Tax=Amycolatopsis bartoniae TaxID=941986 RepID=A0A8H9IV51_9PSEU|nr:thiamine pyrophosphate-binding protein [Amycolatopsis bartoniae]MBB2934472.1 acetolactate synthase-1/2/3 large subunit [Amycolatopsis bartoniae]TVT02205.1 thiamine pyrophosphate-binding protein [Amycolatopsis bartoniae]GHF47151.1 acetolactate synthase I/II/III large subunit [Amycolatopsis bartoniae]
MNKTGAEHLVDVLAELGTEVAFGLPGVHNLPIWEAIAGSGIRLVGARHEQTAGYAADGYARATGKLGVALVTTGPGAANTLAAVGEAMASASPVLVIATDIPSTLRRPDTVRGVLHETSDQAAMFAPVTKATITAASPRDIAPAVARAARIAREPQSGPVYVGIPTDFLRAETERGPDTEVTERFAAVNLDDLDLALALLSGAERPLIWAGGGALRAEAGPVVGELAEKLTAPVITTFAARGLLPPGHPCLAPTPVHAPEVGALWDEADVVLGVGTDFDGLMTQNWRMPRPPKLIAVNVDPKDAAKNYQPDVTLVGDARDIVARLVSGLVARPGLPDLTGRLRAVEERVRRRVRAEEPQAADFLGTLEETLPAGAVVVADMCVAGYWAGGYHRVSGPRRFAYPMGWGTLGFGFPASLGAAAAGSSRVVCVSGDGGFLYGCGDLATLAQESLPVTVIIVDDGGYGMLRFDQTRAGVPHRGVDLHTPNFVGLARSFGVDADEVKGFGRAFRRLLSEFVRADEPNVLVVRAALKPPVNTSPRWYRTG